MVECPGSELLHEDVVVVVADASAVDVVADAPAAVDVVAAVVSAPELPENVVS